MGFPIPSLSSNAQSGSDGILDGLTFGGSFQVGGSGAKLSAAGPEALNTAQSPVMQANMGMMAVIAVSVFALMLLKGKF